jgi:hypothetical protein
VHIIGTKEACPQRAHQFPLMGIGLKLAQFPGPCLTLVEFRSAKD